MKERPRMSLSVNEISNQVGLTILDSFPTGSNYICNPPVDNTDIDYMVLLPKDNKTLVQLNLYGKQWEHCGENYGEDDKSNFMAFRKGKYNLILTDNPLYFQLFRDATTLAKKLNLLEKQQRVALFKYVIEGEIE